ncbi:GNAT family N-acetyltransferase [Streptococcus gordonii]|uniref:GNAT family N-acetyltransferase n=1 Tax=Streptococcus gordonii TaxID=1302 RepID=UPI002955558A|nr:GNAT family N-acetyltransferase [Streptococcus gordonii]
MSLTSQIITADFPDLDKVEALNNEAFPEEERIPLSEFLRYEEQEDANFFAFYHEKEFVGFAFAISNAQAFYVSFFAIMPHLRSHGYGGEIIEKLVNFYQQTMILEIERLDEQCDNLEQRQARWDFYQSKPNHQSVSMPRVSLPKRSQQPTCEVMPLSRLIMLSR